MPFPQRPIKIFSGDSKFVPDPKSVKVEKPKYNLSKNKTSKSELTGLRTVADKAHSAWTKRRDNKNGFFVCPTCDKTFKIEVGECGHYVKRGENIVRLDSRNAHTQCHECNGHHNGQQKKHGEFIDRKYGKGTAEELMWLSKQPYKLDREFLEKKIEEYKLIPKK